MTLAQIRQYLLGVRRFILFATALFLLGVLIGTFLPEPFYRFVCASMAKAKTALIHGSYIAILLRIFAHNVVAGYGVLLGGLLFGLVPVIALLFNGAVVGVVLRHHLASGFGSALLVLLPHGIFEVPAFLVASGLGIWCGRAVLRLSFRGAGERWHVSTRLFLRVVTPLLLVAATIEAILVVARN